MTSLKEKREEWKFDLDERTTYNVDKYDSIFFEKDVKETILEFKKDINPENMYIEEGVMQDIIQGRLHLKSILKNREDREKINNAIKLLENFENLCVKHKDFGGYN